MQLLNNFYVKHFVVYIILKYVIATEDNHQAESVKCNTEEIQKFIEQNNLHDIGSPETNVSNNQSMNTLLLNDAILNIENQNENETFNSQDSLRVDQVGVSEENNTEFSFLHKNLPEMEDFQILTSLLEAEKGNEEHTKVKKLVENEIILIQIKVYTDIFMEKNPENFKLSKIFNEKFEIQKKNLLNELDLNQNNLKIYIKQTVYDLICFSDYQLLINKKMGLFKDLIYDYFDQEGVKHENLQNNLKEKEINLTQLIDKIYFKMDGEILATEDLKKSQNFFRKDMGHRKLELYALSLRIQNIKDKIIELEEFSLEKPESILNQNKNIKDYNGLSFEDKFKLYKNFVLNLVKINEFIDIELKKLQLKINNRNQMVERLINYNKVLINFYIRSKDYESGKQYKDSILGLVGYYVMFKSEMYEKVSKDILNFNFSIDELKKEKKLNYKNIETLLTDLKKNENYTSLIENPLINN
ncbi:hypothetical protein GVAV_001914 [Gurleya vavrai]